MSDISTSVIKDGSEAGVEKTETYRTPEDQILDERRIIRRVDLRMLPLLGLLYSVALIDRINLGSARAAGMGSALGLSIGARYSIASCLYFVPYIILQIPGNIMVRKFGARNWLSFIVLFWGAVTIAMGFVTTWGLLTLCRVLLGGFEAGFFPALAFIITTWYKRHEVQKRLAFFYLSSIFIAGFGSIIAYTISLLNGRRGIAGWSWIFIIEGSVTVALSILSWLFIPDFPDKNTFLTPEETRLVLKRIEDDRGDALPDDITFKKILNHLGDWTIWAYGLCFAASTMPSYALAYFAPIIIHGMGWKNAQSLLLTAPLYAPAAVSAFCFAWLSDKTQKRAIFIALQTLLSIIGLSITAYSPKPHIRYFGLFLLNAGSSGCIPGILAYSANNVVSHSKRSVTTAVVVAFGGVGGILASTVFREQDSPRYIPGLWVTMGWQFLMLALLGITTLHFRRLNALRREDAPMGSSVVRPGIYYTL